MIRLAIASLARAVELDEEKVDDLRMAVSEACANSVIAHESSGSEDSIVVRWLEEGGRITVEVEDRVAPAAAAVEDSQGFSSREVMSLALLESLVDSSESVEVPGGGSKVRLVVARS